MKYLISLFFLLSSMGVNANLLISPTRINFNDRDRIQEVILINTGSQERIYRIGWSEKKALEEGGYAKLEESDTSVSPLRPYIRFSPRQVKLQAGERQIIKLQLRKKTGMESAEYRSHLAFTVLPPEEPISSTDDDPVDGIRMKVNMFLSYSIPVLYHPSTPDVAVSITQHSISLRNDQSADLNLVLARSGNNSAYGRLEVYAEIDGEQKRIGLANNVAVYQELTNVKTQVRLPDFRKYANLSKINIKFIGEKEYAGRTFTDKTVTL